MSKPVKNLIISDYRSRIADADGAVLVSLRGMTAQENTALRAKLAEKGMRLTIVKNTLAVKATQGTPLDGIAPLLSGQVAMVYGGESVVNVAREIVALAKEQKKIEFRGAVMENSIFSAEGVEALSKYPTRDEAISQLVGGLLGPGSKLGGLLKSTGNIAGLIKAIETKLEAGEEIKKAG